MKTIGLVMMLSIAPIPTSADTAQPDKNGSDQYTESSYGDGLTHTLCSVLRAEEARLEQLQTVSEADAPLVAVAELGSRLDCLLSEQGPLITESGESQQNKADPESTSCMKDPLLRNDPDCRLNRGG